MADPKIRQARGIFTGTVGSTDVTAGSPVYFDGTDWEYADSSDNTKYAEAFAVNTYKTGDVGVFCRSAVIRDTDAPYTQGDQYFLSETAGSITATRPTTAASLRQVLGFALSTSELYVDIPPVKEATVPLITTGATSAYALLDSGNFGGPTLDASAETLSLFAQVPENCVGLETAHLWIAAEATAGTPTMDITVSAADTGEQWDVRTADTTLANAVREGSAADEIFRLAAATGFDATGVISPGRAVGVKCAQDDAGTDISFVFGGTLVCLVV